MFYLVSYDIPDDKRRTRLAKAIKDFGDRVQYSVFECLLDDALFEQMTDRITSIIDMNEDSVRIYRMCGSCEKKIQIIGQGDISRIEEVYIL
ncbi:MAG: CRISPR-associated endonuclease Cas2 [Desulfobacteraceae bacterium]|jgi:CRISPR-associated protein Cas2